MSTLLTKIKTLWDAYTTPSLDAYEWEVLEHLYIISGRSAHGARIKAIHTDTVGCMDYEKCRRQRLLDLGLIVRTKPGFINLTPRGRKMVVDYRERILPGSDVRNGIPVWERKQES